MDTKLHSDLLNSRDIKEIKLSLIKSYTKSVLRHQADAADQSEVVEFYPRQELDRLAS